MSTTQDSQKVWSNLPNEVIQSKYEKCRNITEEIYKRINLTFEIKKLETTAQSEVSDNSDDMDSNEMSNETDLFACDKSDITSSTEPEKSNKINKPLNTCEKYININNNEEKIKAAGAVYKRPKKRFRKRVKKRQTKSNRSDTEGSSDEGLPLSRIVDIVEMKCKSGEEQSKSDSPDVVMGVPKIIIITKDLKTKIKNVTYEKSPEKKSQKETRVAKVQRDKSPKPDEEILNREAAMLKLSLSKIEERTEVKNCSLCSLKFRGERGLRRHMTMSHMENGGDTKKCMKNVLQSRAS